MPKYKTNIIDIDLAGYMIYSDKANGQLIAIPVENRTKIETLIAEYEDILNIPKGNKVSGLKLDYNEETNAYSLISKLSYNFEISELNFVWINFISK